MFKENNGGTIIMVRTTKVVRSITGICLIIRFTGNPGKRRLRWH